MVEDDPDILEAVRQVLQGAGFTVHAAATGTEGVAAVRRHDPSVVTLDLTLPDIDGFEVARQVREFSDTYIIMVTARTEELDTLMGLESGADDYITKPFRPRELRARIEALLRRARDRTMPEPETAAGHAHPAGAFPARTVPGHEPAGRYPATPLEPASELDHSELEHNGLRLNPATRTVWIDGAEVELTRTEFDLLLALMRAGRVVRPKSELARVIRAGEYDTGMYISEAEERTIEVHVGNMRRKLGDDARFPRWVETVRGVGYRLAPAARVLGAVTR